MTTGLQGTRYFATYFEVVGMTQAQWDRGGKEWTMRRQWVTMPKHPRQAAHVCFYRFQNRPDHKAVWKNFEFRTPEEVLRHFRNGAANIAINNQCALERDPIVVEIFFPDLEKYVSNTEPGKPLRRTPYRVLELARDRARSAGWVL